MMYPRKSFHSPVERAMLLIAMNRAGAKRSAWRAGLAGGSIVSMSAGLRRCVPGHGLQSSGRRSSAIRGASSPRSGRSPDPGGFPASRPVRSGRKREPSQRERYAPICICRLPAPQLRSRSSRPPAGQRPCVDCRSARRARPGNPAPACAGAPWATGALLGLSEGDAASQPQGGPRSPRSDPASVGAPEAPAAPAPALPPPPDDQVAALQQLVAQSREENEQLGQIDDRLAALQQQTADDESQRQSEAEQEAAQHAATLDALGTLRRAGAPPPARGPARPRGETE